MINLHRTDWQLTAGLLRAADPGGWPPSPPPPLPPVSGPILTFRSSEPVKQGGGGPHASPPGSGAGPAGVTLPPALCIPL